LTNKGEQMPFLHLERRYHCSLYCKFECSF